MPRGGPKPGCSLADLFPAQADEWHPTKNGDLKPPDVSPGNNNKVWWKCGRCGAAWLAIINNRTVKQSLNCVDCNRGRKQRIQAQAELTPADSIAERAPSLASDWHPTKNQPLTPKSTPVGWGQNIWWTCNKCEHEWALPPEFRNARTDRGCPQCAGPPVGAHPLRGGALSDTHPGVAEQWHVTRNDARGPDSYASDSEEEVWWRCPDSSCGHEWIARITTRTAGKRRGCPVCHRPDSDMPARGESLAALHPNVVADWHPTLNGRLDPHTVKPRSQKKAWWVCADCGFVWRATPANRTAGKTGCAPCSYRQRIAERDRPESGRSLADLFPALVPEWHPTQNDRSPQELRQGSDLRAWWICARGHVWQAHVYARTGTDKTGCPDCRDLPADGDSLGDLRPDLVQQWHATLNEGRQPHEFSLGSAFLAWWQCPIGHVWRARIVNRAKPDGSGCTQCRTWGTSQQQIRLAHELEAAGCPVVHNHDRIPVPSRSPVNADIVVLDYQIVIEFDGSQFHLGVDAAARDIRQTQALEAAGWRVIRVRPAPLEQLRPEDVMIADGRDTKCAANAVLQRIQQLGYAPAHAERYCADPQLWAVAEADKEIQARFARSLSTLFPQIAAEWHPSLNGDRRPEFTNPGSRDRAWWHCSSCGHDWKTAPKKRTGDGSGCPNCARDRRAAARRQPKPGRSVADMFPQLLRIFHPTKNGDTSLWELNYGTTVELWWFCPDCHNEWSTRTPRSTGCRRCAAKRRVEQINMPEPDHSFGDLHPAIANEWHPTKNADLLPTQVRETSTKPVWWQCRKCGREWQRSPGLRISTGAGCRRCSARRAGSARKKPSLGASLLDTHPHLAREWIDDRNPGLSPKSLKSNSMELAWWRCSQCGHEWSARIDTRALRGHGCKKCASAHLSISRRRPRPGCSMADVKPELLVLWHPSKNVGLEPTDLKPNSHTRVWWQCPDCAHEWQATPGRPGCRRCATKRSTASQTRPSKTGLIR
ncbi:zinc-ribbon domain-containing protein [Mycobacterium sp. RTGN5]|uniref:zinc-ribbon domain-containing protein n=1 Tax=Mycobacterium sp. RTGN5 TaxID=3016522 RepID=UPI0039B66F9D